MNDVLTLEVSLYIFFLSHLMHSLYFSSSIAIFNYGTGTPILLYPNHVHKFILVDQEQFKVKLSVEEYVSSDLNRPQFRVSVGFYSTDFLSTTIQNYKGECLMINSVKCSTNKSNIQINYYM